MFASKKKNPEREAEESSFHLFSRMSSLFTLQLVQVGDGHSIGSLPDEVSPSPKASSLTQLMGIIAITNAYRSCENMSYRYIVSCTKSMTTLNYYT